MSEQAQETVQPEAPKLSPEDQHVVATRDRIARELFGSEYYGKAPEEPKPDETEETKSADTETGEEAPKIDEPTEGEEPEEGAEEETALEDGKGETPIATLAELAEHLETDQAFLNGIKVPVTVDGTPTEATIADLVKSYQIITAAENRLTDAKTIAQRESEAWTAKQQELGAQFQVLAEMIKHEEAVLERDVKAIDPKLRDTDPAEWAARITEFQSRRDHINKIKVDTVAKYQANAEAMEAQRLAVRNQFTAEQAQILVQRLPEWQDENRAETEKAQIRDYLLRSGFQAQELSDLVDHRHLLLVRKAWLYDQGRGQVDTAKKKVAKVPKVMKPGAPKPAEQRATERLAALKAKMVKSGNPDDALAYTLAKRGVSR